MLTFKWKKENKLNYENFIRSIQANQEGYKNFVEELPSKYWHSM